MDMSMPPIYSYVNHGVREKATGSTMQLEGQSAKTRFRFSRPRTHHHYAATDKLKK